MSKTITLNHITKIEGHASLNLKIEKGKVQVCELSSTEGARYFEGILLQKRFFEAHEISSRICGICSCAHTICASMAIEDALNMNVSEQTVHLRELITLGERIRSHATHLYFLALPDYLGYESALSMLPKYKTAIVRAIKMTKIGNIMIRVIGGRDLHPVSNTIGGFLKLPSNDSLKKLKADLKSIKPDADATVKLFLSLKQRNFDRKVDYMSLTNPNKYAILTGTLKSETSNFDKKDFHDHINEYRAPYNTANFLVKDGNPVRVGALARFNNNSSQLSKDARSFLKKSGLKLPNYNPFNNNLAQAIELVHCIDYSIKLLNSMEIVPETISRLRQIPTKAGHGIGAIEVPRGTLWHEYSIDDKGIITAANIITPTVQNLKAMEDDIRNYVPLVLDMPKDKVVIEIEKLIRSYDPCFSCSTHFLKVNWK